MDILYIVMPAYNEEVNIEKVVRSWYGILKDKNLESRLVVADAGSMDSTDDILRELQQELPQLEILKDSDRFHGPKVIALYKYAIQKGADYIFQTDSDGQTNPQEFHAFWELRKDFDGVFGYRRDRGDGVIRAFVERVVCCLLFIFFGVSIPDANAPFRLMSTAVVKKYIGKMRDEYALPNIMMTTWFKYYGEKIVFEPISFRPRSGGVNSINFWKIVKIGWRSLGDFAYFSKEMNK